MMMSNFILNGKVEKLPYNDCGFWINFRYWLVRKLAGKAMVVLNAQLSLVKSEGSEVFKWDTKGSKNGLLFRGNTLRFDEGLVLLVQPCDEDL